MDELISRVDQYLDRDSSLEDFECWFYDLAFDVERSYTGEYVDLIHRIEGILAESTAGHWRTVTLDNELERVVSPYRKNPRVIVFRELRIGTRINSLKNLVIIPEEILV